MHYIKAYDLLLLTFYNKIIQNIFKEIIREFDLLKKYTAFNKNLII